MQVAHDAENISTDMLTSVKLLCGVINSELDEMELHQVKEKQMDNNEEKIETYNEEGIPNETIECRKDNQDFIFNVNNVEEMKGCKEESTCNEADEHCKNKLINSSINIDNVVKTEDYKAENYKEEDHKEESHKEDYEEEDSMFSQSIEYPVDTKDSIDNLVDTLGTQENIPTGCCIVDISFIWSELHKIFNNHARGIDCQFKYWKLVNYRRRGLLTQFFFKCEMCHYKASIWSEPIDKKPDINTAIVAGSVATGIGFSKLKQLFASMDIAFMSEKTYIKYRENLVTKDNDMKNVKNKIISKKN